MIKTSGSEKKARKNKPMKHSYAKNISTFKKLDVSAFSPIELQRGEHVPAVLLVNVKKTYACINVSVHRDLQRVKCNASARANI